jgi:hypothetical protein
MLIPARIPGVTCKYNRDMKAINESRQQEGELTLFFAYGA